MTQIFHMAWFQEPIHQRTLENCWCKNWLRLYPAPFFSMKRIVAKDKCLGKFVFTLHFRIQYSHYCIIYAQNIKSECNSRIRYRVLQGIPPTHPHRAGRGWKEDILQYCMVYALKITWITALLCLLRKLLCPFHQLNRSMEFKMVPLLRERDYTVDCYIVPNLYKLSSIVKLFSWKEALSLFTSSNALHNNPFILCSSFLVEWSDFLMSSLICCRSLS